MIWHGGSIRKSARGPRGIAQAKSSPSKVSNMNKFKPATSASNVKMNNPKSGLKPVVWPAVFYQELQKRLCCTCNFAPIDATDSEFTEIVAAINKMCNTKVPAEIAFMMRGPILTDKGIKSHMMMLKDINELAARYAAGEDIISLSREKCYPPVSVFRRILLHRGMSETAVKQLVGKVPDASAPINRQLSARDIEQLQRAWKEDTSNPITNAQRAAEAAKEEAAFVEWFKTQKVAFCTQEELAKKQTEESGRALITPDVLITGEYYVSGVRIHWIDFKDYVACPVSYVQRGCQEQAAKYTEKWGQGAFCFRGGSVEGFNLTLLSGKNPLVLSYTHE